MRLYSHHRRAFTLVELLVTMATLSILAGMLAIALSGAQRQAKDTRAQGMIDRLNLAVLNIYEQETRRRVSARTNFATSSSSHALSLLLWKRDWLRCAMPDSKTDLIEIPRIVQYPVVTSNRRLVSSNNRLTGLGECDPTE